jgi:hypothetical protein
MSTPTTTMKYNRFNEHQEREHQQKKREKRREKEITHKCFLVFCLWRRNAVMVELQTDDPSSRAVGKELKRQWRNLAQDEIEAYFKLTLLLLSSPASNDQSKRCSYVPEQPPESADTCL